MAQSGISNEKIFILEYHVNFAYTNSKLFCWSTTIFTNYAGSYNVIQAEWNIAWCALHQRPVMLVNWLLCISGFSSEQHWFHCTCFSFPAWWCNLSMVRTHNPISSEVRHKILDGGLRISWAKIFLFLSLGCVMQLIVALLQCWQSCIPSNSLTELPYSVLQYSKPPYWLFPISTTDESIEKCIWTGWRGIWRWRDWFTVRTLFWSK